MLAFAPGVLAAGYQQPTLLPLIYKLEKTRDFIEKRVDPGAIERVALPPIHSHYMRGLTGTKHPQIIYNMRRLNTQAGGVRDTLYAILPDVTSTACTSGIKETHGRQLRYVVALQPVKVAPDQHTIVDDTQQLPAGAICIETPDGHFLFTMALATRVKRPGHEWQLQKN